jgi:hypothetical protein
MVVAAGDVDPETQDLGLEVNIDGPEKVSATIEDQGKGSYLVMYKVQTPGVYKVRFRSSDFFFVPASLARVCKDVP